MVVYRILSLCELFDSSLILSEINKYNCILNSEIGKIINCRLHGNVPVIFHSTIWKC